MTMVEPTFSYAEKENSFHIRISFISYQLNAAKSLIEKKTCTQFWKSKGGTNKGNTNWMLRLFAHAYVPMNPLASEVLTLANEVKSVKYLATETHKAVKQISQNSHT